MHGVWEQDRILNSDCRQKSFDLFLGDLESIHIWFHEIDFCPYGTYHLKGYIFFYQI